MEYFYTKFLKNKKNYPRYDLEARIQHTKLDSWGSIPSARLNRVEEPATADFQSVMSGLVEGLNTSMNAPDNLLRDAMMGSENVDIHDVMVAMCIIIIGQDYGY